MEQKLCSKFRTDTAVGFVSCPYQFELRIRIIFDALTKHCCTVYKYQDEAFKELDLDR